MKVLCSACEAAEACVLCCADEAALCARCDRDVHAANRLAGKHLRLPIQPPAVAPNCDICQESHAYFFCVEDRALLCRSCDVAVHSANAFVSAHRRFLLTGAQVGLHAQHQTPAASTAAPDPLHTPPPPPADKAGPAPLYSDDDIDWSLVDEQFTAPEKPAEPKPASKRTAVAAAYGSIPDWPLDEFFGFSDLNAGLGFAENGTSKADSGKLGSTDGSPNGLSSSDSAAQQDLFGQVAEVHHHHQWSVPELPSPPTASGLHWQAAQRHRLNGTATDAAAMFVPDISSPENPFRCFAAGTGHPQPAKRRRC